MRAAPSSTARSIMRSRFVEILAMHDRVDGERQAGLRAPARRRRASCACAPAKPAMRSPLAVSASWMLSCTCSRPASTSSSNCAGSSQHARGDEIAVKADLAGVAHQAGEIAAHRRLAAGEMHLQHAERRRLARARAATSRCRARCWRAPARSGWSNRGIAAGSDGVSSARRARGGSGRFMRSQPRVGRLRGQRSATCRDPAA